MSPLHVPVDSFEKVVHQGSIGVGAGERAILASVQCAIFHNRQLATWQLCLGLRKRIGDYSPRRSASSCSANLLSYQSWWIESIPSQILVSLDGA